MKQLKIFITLILLLLWLTVANAVYEEPMGETIEVNEIEEETWFIYPEGAIRKVSDALGGKWTLAEAIVIWCQNHSEDYNLCVKNVFWVANAESSLFKNVSSSNNAFWRMYNWKLRRFSSLEEWIVQRIKLYEKNNRQVRGLSWQRWLDWNYCASECTYWVRNYNQWIAIAESAL